MKTVLKALPSFLLILLFVYAAISKLLDYNDFRGQLHNQDIPYWMAELLWIALPPAELITAGLLLFDRTYLSGLAASAALLILFTGYIGLVLLGVWSRVPCSCGGILSTLSWGWHFLFNVIFLLIGLIAIRNNLKYSPLNQGLKETR